MENTLADAIADKVNKGFRLACKPLMDYLAKNHHPHTKVIVESNRSELVEGKICYKDMDFKID